MLGCLSGITIKLQEFTINIIQASNEAESFKEMYKFLKCEIDKQLHIIYERAVLCSTKCTSIMF